MVRISFPRLFFLKYSERLPHKRIADLLKRDYGLSITPSSISGSLA
ncbi:MAG: hypothetical protein AB1297_04655 [bacterium]